MRDCKDVHEAEVTTDVDDVGYGSLMALAQLGSAPSMNATVNEDTQGGEAEGEEIDKHEQP